MIGQPSPRFASTAISWRRAARGCWCWCCSNQPESLLAYRFCKDQGIEARLFDVPPEGRIADEGHFNARGNEAVAGLALRLLQAAPNEAGS